MAQYLYIWVGACWFSATSLSKWPPGGHIGFFGFRTNFTLALNINSKLQWQSTYAYWFSATLFSKWLPGSHIRFFGFWMAWFRQRNSSLFWNFSFKFHVHVLCGCRQKPNESAMSLSKWLPCDFEQCHPLVWGGGILVDHCSTISSYFCRIIIILLSWFCLLLLMSFVFRILLKVVSWVLFTQITKCCDRRARIKGQAG